jgi:hypothetical protein
MSKIQGADQFGSTYSVKIWTTDFSGSEPSGSGMPCGGGKSAELGVTGVVAPGVAGAIAAGRGLAGLGAPPGTIGVEVGGIPGAALAVPPAGGVTVVEEAAKRGNRKKAKAIRQMPRQRRDNM